MIISISLIFITQIVSFIYECALLMTTYLLLNHIVYIRYTIKYNRLIKIWSN